MTFVAETVRSHPRPGSNSNGDVVYGWNTNRGGNADICLTEDAAPPIIGTHGGVLSGDLVRRLTPIECERLQAWPDNWTNPDGKAPDSRRYAACGDGVTATVSEWIGRRLLAHRSDT